MIIKLPESFSLSGSFVICAFSHAAEVYLSHRTTVLTEIGPQSFVPCRRLFA